VTRIGHLEVSAANALFYSGSDDGLGLTKPDARKSTAGLAVLLGLAQLSCATRKTETVTRSLLQHLAEDVLQDAAVLVVGDFLGRVDADGSGEGFDFAVGRFGADGDALFG
jgi:hypothetical protein